MSLAFSKETVLGIMKRYPELGPVYSTKKGIVYHRCGLLRRFLPNTKITQIMEDLYG